MNKDDIIAHLIGGTIIIGILILTVTLSALIYTAVMASNLPDWLKYFLLR